MRDVLEVDAETVLVAGPSLAGGRRCFHRLLRDRGAGTVAVATRQPAEPFRDAHRHQTAADPAETDDLVVVDCLTRALGKSPSDGPRTVYAQHPSNLTSIGTKFTQVVDRRGDEPLAAGISTLSPLLQYADRTDVYQFAHLLVQQATGVGWPVVAAIDAGAHDEQTVEQFVPLFDAVVETRRPDDGEGCEYRVRDPEETDWRPL
ncbi:hypothetical protein GJ633_03265 [Halorubrum sp. CBA1125]|uniref:DUF7504 family protein n=1 Tax=Halorubrum sp. CBA1125 TaxID=2668072 RepID=UPI0012E91CFB|nr:hypothetical protein [Halorubrum sp. CBA1125]MUW13789.1 hypothetical protein [Halorubrum sp. CBA1125]